ncbi:hypothetical protein [Bradyrhizobium sp. WSM2793]|uniref:hypothetical protein n=1 Tax=Bradyrhizobium sp. WSM2793 TaxID=1038866 RepID=UPI0012F82868|nr:hypothetical protein [Bradyrhizobium sp. WSM2793]
MAVLLIRHPIQLDLFPNNNRPSEAARCQFGLLERSHSGADKPKNDISTKALTTDPPSRRACALAANLQASSLSPIEVKAMQQMNNPGMCHTLDRKLIDSAGIVDGPIVCLNRQIRACAITLEKQLGVLSC